MDCRIVDMHSHILSDVDHGSQSVEMSVNMVLQAKKAGVAAVVATPHFYAHTQSVDEFIAKRDASFECLKNELNLRNIEMDLYKGAEVALETDLVETKGVGRLCIGDTNCILLEMPFGSWSAWVFDAVYEIEARFGVRVIIAHIERYGSRNIQKLIDLGFQAQVNASIFATHKGRKLAQSLFYGGYINFIGSDAHDLTERNYAEFEKILKKPNKLEREMLEEFSQNANSLLRSESKV